jgi:uncharacterized protein
MGDDARWCASALALAEAQITLCHLGLTVAQLRLTKDALRADWERFVVVPVDAMCLARAREIGCEQGVLTLDAIHLAAAERIPRPASFLTFDERQRDAAARLGLHLIPED